MCFRLIVPALLFLCCSTFTHAHDTAALARELVTIKGGYADKKKHLEELRIRAYIPILLKAVGKGPAWKPGHPHWAETERRIAEDWRKHYLDYLARMGRDASYGWMDDTLAQEYAKVFSGEEFSALLALYRSTAGGALLALEKEFLGFYPGEMVRSLARVMLGTEAFSAREQAQFRSPENRERRDFVVMFETEPVIHGETLRIGNPYVDTNRPVVQQGALATAADNIDALRRKLNAAALAELQTFLNSEIGRNERAFLGAAIPTATPAKEDPAHAAKEEAAFYKGLQQLSAQWRELAAGTAAR